MNSDLIILVVQIIAALGVVISVIYLGIQIHQQNEITKAQFGHSLTQRLYDRYFNTTKDKEFSLFLKYIFNETENVSDEWTSKSAESVNASLTRLLPRLRKKCLGSNVILPKSDPSGSSSSLFQESVNNTEISDFGFSALTSSLFALFQSPFRSQRSSEAGRMWFKK